MTADKPSWEDQEETIVSFVENSPRPPAGTARPDDWGDEDNKATIIASRKAPQAGAEADRTVVAGAEPVPGQIEIMAWLVVTETLSVRRGEIFALNKLRNDIGRGAGVAIFLNDKKVGHSHAAVKYEVNPAGAPQFVLYDLASTNGTFLNDQRLSAPLPLKDGDRIRLGDTLLVFKQV